MNCSNCNYAMSAFDTECPRCHNQVAAPPKAATASDSAALAPCPYCAEAIQPNAQKCRFCGEWLGVAAPATPNRVAVAPLPNPTAAENPMARPMASGLGLGMGAALGWGCIGPMLGCLGLIVVFTILAMIGAMFSNYATSPERNSANTASSTVTR